MAKQKDMGELFKHIIDVAITDDDMTMVNMLFVSMISADNNETEEEIKTNCEHLEKFIEVADHYPDNEKIKDLKAKAIDYNKVYYKK